MSGMARFEDSAPVFAALGDPKRLALLNRLCAEGPGSITRLTAGSTVTRQAVTQHLEVLAGVGLVKSTRAGRERIWEVETKKFDEARERLEQISTAWDRALWRLKKFVEE
jgi:DNA-binding transcriptional ArsR family regulator